MIEDFGDNWHTLDIIQAFEIPDAIEMADLYSDKAHSMQRAEVLHHVRTKPNVPIPGKRVLETMDH